MAVQVDTYGGMQNKYKLLVENFMLWPDSKITLVTRERIEITSAGQGLTAERYIINEGDGVVEIMWQLKMAFGKESSKKWTFKHDSSQEKMLEVIANSLKDFKPY
ncbi:MAG TPA: hypothetical protein PK110_14860 [Niabella sp.]|nr:hypothetical protein [Niabella sp.]